MVVQLVLELPECCWHCWLRSGKNTHISRISNSVTHVRSYTNTIIADIGRNCMPSINIGEPSADDAASSADIFASIGECSNTIVEETLTSGKYVSLFLISILYIYIKLKKLCDDPLIFWRNMQKLAIRGNCASEVKKCILFVVILQVKTLIAIVYRPQEKNMQITLNAHWIFIIIHHFCMATFKSQYMGRWKT